MWDFIGFWFNVFWFGIAPWLTLAASIYLFAKAIPKKSWRIMLASLVTFMLVLIFLIYMKLSLILNWLWILVVLQVGFIAIYYLKEQKKKQKRDAA